MIQTSKYTVFCRVVELGSFSLAAEELGYTQSSVSQKVLSLEEELGVTLLLRQKNRLELTSDGEISIPLFKPFMRRKKTFPGRKKKSKVLKVVLYPLQLGRV